MKKESLITILIIFILLLIIIIPKNIILSINDEKFNCKCIGIKNNEKCIGKNIECKKIIENIESKKIKETKIKNDILFIIDTSTSMKNERMSKTKEIAKEIIKQSTENDRISIITFSTDAKILNELTNNKEALIKIIDSIDENTVGGDTNYIPPINIAKNIMQAEKEDIIKKIIFFGDGDPSRYEEMHRVYFSIEELLNNNICIYSFSYNHLNLKESLDTLNNFADMSYKINKCGRFFNTKEEIYNLENQIKTIYQDNSLLELKIEIHSPTTSIYEQDFILVNITTNIDSRCAYSLNNENLITIYHDEFNINVKNGNNSLKIYCKRDINSEWESTKSINFYVNNKKTIIDSIKKFIIKEKEVINPSKEEVKDILKEIFEEEKLNVIKRTIPKDDGSIIYLMIENTKFIKLKNIKIRQIIPSYIAGDINKIKSSDNFKIISINPVILEFEKEYLMPEEITTINYYLDNYINNEDLKTIETHIYYDDITDDEVDELFNLNSDTQDYFEIKRSSITSNKNTIGRITLTPKNKLNDVNVYLNIPKCMALDINELYFKNTAYKIIANDPIILWHFDNVENEIDIEYKVNKKLKEDCEKEITFITFANEINEEIINEKKYTPIKSLFIILIFPFCFIISAIIFQSHNSENKKESPLFKYIILIIFIIIIVFLLYPKKEMQKDYCECFGINIKNNCHGLLYSCISTTNQIKERKTNIKQYCENNNCSIVDKYIKINPTMITENLDLTLIIDKSKSMEGELMEKAKQASISFIYNLKENDKASIITFDKDSEIIHNFSNNKTSLIESITNIKVGTSTFYVPAFKNAYYNHLLNSNNYNKDLILFISDGEPKEEIDEIMKIIELIINEGICITTIGYGNEITQGSKAEKILKKIAEISNKKLNCGTYYYSPDNIELLNDILSEAYKQAIEVKDNLKIDYNINSLKISENEELRINAFIFSSHNYLQIPGQIIIDNQNYCSPKANVNLLLIDKNEKTQSYNFIFDETSDSYILNKKMPTGEFEAKINAKVVTNDGCIYEKTIDIGHLIVEKKDSEKKCIIDNCNDVKRYIFSEDDNNLINIIITDYAFIPQNISIKDNTTVIWRNIGQKPHTVTSGINVHDGFLHSGIIMPNETFEYTFKKGTKFDYFDNLSIKIKGNIVQDHKKDISFGKFKLEYKKPIDLIIIIDTSSSMFGDGIIHLKKAATELIEMLYPNDRVALIEFSDDAIIRQPFTNNKELLQKIINDLYPKGSTYYIPAFNKAEELFNNRKIDEDNDKIIIFFSDGMPWDKNKPNSIYEKIKKMTNNDICIYSIGYGSEIYYNKEAEKILNEIVKISQESASCGKYNYVLSDEIRLTKIFGSIYHEASGNVNGIIIESNIIKDIILENETINLYSKLKSRFNNNYIPGFIESTNLCTSPAQLKAKIIDTKGKIIKEQKLLYKGIATGYYTEFSNIPAGIYTIKITAETILEDGYNCGFYTEESKKIIILPITKFKINYNFLLLFGLMLFIMIYFIYNNWKSE
jgi:Mg-chelatase subunit ChlD